MTGIALLALGGTISMVQEDGAAVPRRRAAQLAATDDRYTVAVDVALVGGSEVDGQHLCDLGHHLVELARPAVVTVGTDAIEEVAAWLAWAGPWPQPVAVTGSMIPGGRPDSDGAANLIDAAATVAALPWSEPVVVFGGDVLLGRESLKVSGALRAAFAAPGRGPVGGVGPLGPSVWRTPAPTRGLGLPGGVPPAVPVVTAALGDDGLLLASAIAVAPGAVVVAANGAGNLPPGMARVAVDAAAAGDAVVIVTSRAPDAFTCPVYGYPGGSAELTAAGVTFAPGLTPHRARAVAGLALAHRTDVAAAIRTASDDVMGVPLVAVPT
ncbi:asparaginase [Nitriliruptor alkaliphilus]|uniref:asparaginase n=1 Tax=Nitriliruptor alkaliphilus TaxID=427918 RepID=UPI0009F8EF9A|nr:asparaginase [Nitriliruptor alkaliphilus]